MRPTLRQLQYFLAIAETKRFGEAARQLNVSQSALSAQIVEMESSLGITLFERGRHGALLTPVGQELVPRARVILREVEELKTLARQSGSELSGRVHLGVLPSIGPYLLPIAARQLHQNYPDLRLVVREERTSDLEEGLQTGRLDTIISTAREHRDVVSIPLFREELWICSAPDDPLSQSDAPVSLSEIRDRPLLSLGQGHKLSDIVRAIANEAGAYISSEYEGTSLDAARQMAVMGAGIALLPSLYAFSEARRDPDFIVRRLDHPSAVREIAICWRQASPLAESYQVLADELSLTAQLILSRPESRPSGT